MNRREVEIRDLTKNVALKSARYFSTNSKSFSFAARLFPEETATDVTDVYAFCRFTDDLVDDRRGDSPRSVRDDLRVWRDLSERAHAGETTGVQLIDRPMHTAGRLGIPFSYASELIRGVEMDIEPRGYGTLDDLDLYAHRVAGVVGQWLTQLFGVHHPEILDSAADMGTAMQLTNILRDVGEDLRMDRVYLPEQDMRRFGVTTEWLQTAARGEAPIESSYVALLEHLMAVADQRYGSALAAVPALPPRAQRAVVVAARIYGAIHGEIRRNRYDNLTRRAVVSGFGKKWRAAGALATLPLLRFRHREKRGVRHP